MKVSATFREYENGGTKGFVDYAINNAIGIKGAALLEGEYGMFVNLPAVNVKGEYRDIITGVSNDFRALLLDAALAARDNERHWATVGDETTLQYEPHVTALGDKNKKTKALASLTVRDHADAEKSAFTISNIRIMQSRDNHLFVAMPSVKTNNPDFPYNDICYLKKDSREEIRELLLEGAKKALETERKPSLDDAVKSAAEEKNHIPHKEMDMRDKEVEHMGVTR